MGAADRISKAALVSLSQAPPGWAMVVRNGRDAQVRARSVRRKVGVGLRLSQVKPSQTEAYEKGVSSQVQSSQVKSSQVKSSQVKSSQVKSSQVKSSRGAGDQTLGRAAVLMMP